MRSFKVLALVLFMVAMWSAISFAEGNTTAVDEYTYTFNNNSANPSAHTVSTSVIRPGVDKITAYEVVQYPSTKTSSERLIALYDSTTIATAQELVGEKETSSGSAGDRFSRPRKIKNAVTFYQGAYTTAIVSFIKE